MDLDDAQESEFTNFFLQADDREDILPQNGGTWEHCSSILEDGHEIRDPIQMLDPLS